MITITTKPPHQVECFEGRVVISVRMLVLFGAIAFVGSVAASYVPTIT